MRKIFYIFHFLISLMVTPYLFAQGITIGSGTTFSLGSSIFTLSGNWNNSGTFNAENGTVVFAGASGNQTITNSSGETFNNLTVNKASGDVQLSGNITVNGTLSLTSGNVDMNSNILTIGSSAILTESEGNSVKGAGSLTTTRTLAAPSSVNVLGVSITSTADLGSTVVTRGHIQQTYSGNNSILRYFDITPTTKSGLNATLVFNYFNSELNSLTESELTPYKSEDGGSTWALVSGSSLDASANTVTMTGVNTFSRFTLAASSAPLPVELVSFTAAANSGKVELQWKTATEINNYGFEIHRSLVNGDQSASAGNPKSEIQNPKWEKIGFVQGAGNSNSPKNYSFTDKTVLFGEYSYRLKQVDNDGTFKYSEKVNINAGTKPVVFKLTNYPDPFNPATTIRYEIPEASNVNVSVYNTIGEKVATLFSGNLNEGIYQNTFDGRNLTSGMYILALTTDKNVSIVKKVMLIK